MKLLQLFFAFFRIGLFSIGGGYAIIPMIHAGIYGYHNHFANDAGASGCQYLDLCRYAGSRCQRSTGSHHWLHLYGRAYFLCALSYLSAVFLLRLFHGNTEGPEGSLAGADHVRRTDSACNCVFQKRGFEADLFAACGSRYFCHRAMDQQKMENQSDCIDAAVRSAWRMDLSVAPVSAAPCRFKNQGFLGCEIEFSS